MPTRRPRTRSPASLSLFPPARDPEVLDVEATAIWSVCTGVGQSAIQALTSSSSSTPSLFVSAASKSSLTALRNSSSDSFPS
jgi:hypothetical protein